MNTPCIDQVAREAAAEAKAMIVLHERVSAVSDKQMSKSIEEIRRILSWGNRSLLLVLLGVIGWLASMVFKIPPH